MSKELHVRCRRFIDLDGNGNEIKDEENYGYTLYDDFEEYSVDGMKRGDIEPLLRANAEYVSGIVADICDDKIRYSFENAMGYGICLNGRWL